MYTDGKGGSRGRSGVAGIMLILVMFSCAMYCTGGGCREVLGPPVNSEYMILRKWFVDPGILGVLLLAWHLFYVSDPLAPTHFQNVAISLMCGHLSPRFLPQSISVPCAIHVN